MFNGDISHDPCILSSPSFSAPCGQGAGVSHDGWVASSQTSRFRLRKNHQRGELLWATFSRWKMLILPMKICIIKLIILIVLLCITKMAILVLLQFQWMKKLINLWSFWNSKEEVRDKVSVGHPAYNEYKEWLESVRVRKLQVSCRTRPRPKWSEVDNSANCLILINIHIIYCNARSTRMVTFPSTVAVIYEIVYTRILGEFIS